MTEDINYTSSTNGYELVKTLSIPANYGYTFNVKAKYNSTQPKGVIISHRNDPYYAEAICTDGSYEQGVTFSDYDESGDTLYIYCKWDAAGANHVVIDGFYINPINLKN